METKLQQEINKVLRVFPEYWQGDTLLKNNLIDDIRSYNEKIIEALLCNEMIKDTYSLELSTGIVFKIEDFISMLRFKNYWDNSYTKYTNEIGLTSEGKYLKYNTDIVLDFPHKDSVLEGGMTKEDFQKKEIYYHNVIAREEIDTLLSPKVLMNTTRYDKDGSYKTNTFKSEDNLILKGNNLIALHSLKDNYKGRIQTIYIDPPFNTSNDSFKYNDRFNESTWLTFMKNRLEIAKELLSTTGNIFIHIDNNESHILKVLCDEIFGEENFVEEYIWAYGSASGGRAAGAKPVNIHDYILHYARDYKNRKQFKQFTPYSEKYIKDWFKYKDDDGRLYQRRHRGKDTSGNNIWVKQYLDESKGVPLTSVWTDINQVYANPQAYKKENKSTSEIELEFGNSGQKPERLIKRILDMSTEKGDIVLDFFMGSGSTAATALKMGRQFVTIEQMEKQVDISINRLKEVVTGKKSGISKNVDWQGGGSFIYAELDSLNDEFLYNIQMASQAEELEEVINMMKKSAYLNFKVDLEKVTTNNETFTTLSLKEQKDVLIQVLDMNQLYLNYSEIEDSQYEISDSVKSFNHSFYQKEGDQHE